MIDYEKRAEESQRYREKYNANREAYCANLSIHSNERLVEKFEKLLSKVWRKQKQLEHEFLTYLYGELGGFHEKTKYLPIRLNSIRNGYGDIKKDRVFIIDSIYYLYMLDNEISKWIEKEQKEKEDGRIFKTNIGWLNSFMDWIQATQKRYGRGNKSNE